VGALWQGPGGVAAAQFGSIYLNLAQLGSIRFGLGQLAVVKAPVEWLTDRQRGAGGFSVRVIAGLLSVALFACAGMVARRGQD